MTDSPLYISFLWHMHQPFYKDPLTGVYRLPWVRLHGSKDYLDMLEILDDFPDIKQVFNFTPSLLEQITDYTDNDARDRFLELSLKEASALDSDERMFILENFFLANWDNMIKPFPRYHDLLAKRGFHLVRSELKRLVRYFSDADLLDLQVLFNLCWIDPMFRARDSFLDGLVKKGRDYTEQEKQLLLSKQTSLLREIIPRYGDAVKKGRIELSVSPFYHPILPLLCDTNSARAAMPDVKLPQKRFSHPEDAEKQIRMGMDYFENVFGYRPVGMWPSEGSVSEEAVRLISATGIQWIGTDEDILAASRGIQMRDSARNLTKPDVLYRPHVYDNVSIVFRDHSISDLIGFVYSQWDPKKAAEDFIGKLLQAWSSVPKNRPHLLSVILDGENAWEYYRNDGHDFLSYLYEGISKEKRLKTVTPSEFIGLYGKGEPLNRLHAGSWIYGNFGVWIGHEEDNRSWDYVSATREDLDMFQKMNPEKDLTEAWKALYIAEGSDWNWWYGDDHSTDSQKDFDELFRNNLIKVYKEIGKDVPARLYVPVPIEDRSIAPAVTMRGFIDPKIDGFVTSYYEWYQGASMDIRKTGGSMHKAEGILSALHYGFNKDKLFLRLDPSVSFSGMTDDTQLSVTFLKPRQLSVVISLKPSLKAQLLKRDDAGWSQIKDIADVAVQDIFEMGISFADIDAKEKEEIDFFVSVLKEDEEIERHPWRGYVSVTVPTPDFEAMLWY